MMRWRCALLALGLAVPAAASVGAGVEKWRSGDYPAAVAIWQPYAAAGDPDALFNMGQAYKLGRGVSQDLAQAQSYYRQAAAKNNLPAQANLGILLFQAGEKPEALRWLRAAADRGESRAQFVLGVALYNGDGAPRSVPAGYAYLLRARTAGLAQAAATLRGIEPQLSYADRSMGEALAANPGPAAAAPVPPAMAAVRPAAPPITAYQLPAAAVPPAGVKAGPVIATPIAAAPPVAAPVAVIPVPRAAAAGSAFAMPTGPAAAVAGPKPVTAAAAANAAPAQPPGVMAQPVSIARGDPVSPAPGVSAPPPTAALPPSPTVTDQRPAGAANPVPAPPLAAKPAAAKPPAAKPPAAKPAVPEAKPPPGWRIQLGAFSTRAQADLAWAAARKRQGDTLAAAKPLFDSAGPVTKLQIGPYADRDAAKALCARLTAAGGACFVTRS